MIMGILSLLASNNADIIATIVVIVAAVIIMSFVVFGLALAAYSYSKKAQAAKQQAEAKKQVQKKASQPAKAKQQKKSPEQAPVTAEEEQKDGGNIFYDIYSWRTSLLLGYQQQLLLSDSSNPLLPAASAPLLLEGGRQLAIAEFAEFSEEQIPEEEEEGLTLKASIAIAMAAAVKHININKKTVAEWLTENYGEEIKLNRRADRTKTGLPLADTHYLIKKDKQKCFIYIYDFDEERSMLLLRADDKTATEIIEQYPSIKKSLFPKSTQEQWYTLIPNIGFETEEEIYDVIALIIARLKFNEDALALEEEISDDEETVAEEIEEELSHEEEEGFTLKESIAIAMAAVAKHININKTTVAEWLTENYGEEILLNRRDNRTSTGLPLADTHYVVKKGKQKCFIYVYDFDEERSMLLLRADNETATEIIEQYPSVKKSLFPKAGAEQWYTLIPNIGFETEEEIYDVIALIIARLKFNEEAPVLVNQVTDVEEAVAEEPVPAEEPGLTLKESIAIAVEAVPKHININKETVAEWLTKKYGDAILLNRRSNRTLTGLPLADTHYINRKGDKKCFIYVYDLDKEKSMLLLRADSVTAAEIIEQYPSVKKSLFPNSNTQQWYTLIPNVGFETEEEIYDIIALVIERLVFGSKSKAAEPVLPAEVTETEVAAEEETTEETVEATEPDEEEDIEEEDEELPPEQVDVEVAARGITLKESIALANAMAQTKINKSTVAIWLAKKYGDEVILNRRENKIKTGLPLADTHYVMRKGKKKCFIYVYELSNGKTFLLLKTDGITASEIAQKDPLFLKSRFPKSKYEQWYTLVPDICYKNAKEVFDVIELVLSRFMEKDESKFLYDKVYAKRNGRRKPGKKFAVNCDTLAKNYKAGETVNIENLKEKGIVPKATKQIKILARGALTKPLVVIADDFSAEAVLYISKIGGTPILTD